MKTTKAGKYLETLAAELEARIASGDLRGYTVAQLEIAVNRYRYLAAKPQLKVVVNRYRYLAGKR